MLVVIGLRLGFNLQGGSLQVSSGNASTALNITLSSVGIAFAQTANNNDIRSASSKTAVYFQRSVSTTEIVDWCVIGF